MIYLLFSILTNASIYLIFKWFDRTGIQTFTAIVMNYITAFVLGIFMVGNLDEALQSASSFPIWTMGGLSLGIIFISIFYLMAITSQKVGVSVTTIASKMSMALAVLLFLWIDPKEKFTAIKGVAIILAIAGVVFASLRTDGAKFQARALMWPLLILLGSTIIDFGIAYFSGFTTTDNERTLYSCLSFGVAGICGICVLIFQLVMGKTQMRMRDVMAGMGLGLVNYGSIYFLVQAYYHVGLPRGTVICVNNLAVVIIAAIAAAFIFKERQTRRNILGILLSVVAICLLAIADLL
ncbi:MAG: hypothetical protein ACKVOK_07695 [Flavobacteriales bacterium]